MEVSLYNYKNDSKITGTFLGFVEQMCLINNGFDVIESFNKIIYSDLDIIETLGGGSARCMLAENFLEKK